MRLTRAAIIAIISACVALGAASVASAYPNGEIENDPRTCADCHGREADEATDTVAATRKGPHGGYTAGTRKCQTCHSVHDAPADGVLLLPGATVEATCTSCHDGTGAAAVYGVIKARTNQEPAAAHSMSGVDATNTIPGGDGNTGGSSTGSFSGPGGTLSCNDCHSPHDSQTVEPFTGDRLRASVTSDTAYAEKSNRLLKQSPTSAETSASVYGAGWCATCHQGRVAQHGAGSGIVQTHPVMDSDEEYYYDRVQGVAGADTTQTALGSLGQSNRGYVVPEAEDPDADPRPAPLCQQCHEDARNVGPSERGTNPMLSEDQTFTVGVYAPPQSEEPTGNPRFQVFPHESDVEYFLVRPVVETVEGTQTATYKLCLGCHSLRHDVPKEYQSCTAEGCHDEGDAIDIHLLAASGCEACHGTTEPLTMDCATCHGADPHPDVDHSVVQQNASMVFFTERHKGGGPVAPTVTSAFACSLCHSDNLLEVDGHDDCSTCHPGSWDGFDRGAGCQQAVCHPTYHDDDDNANGVPDMQEEHNPYASSGSCVTCHTTSGPKRPAEYNFCQKVCHVPQASSTTVAPLASRSVDSTMPVTFTDVQKVYVGPALIEFVITVDGVPSNGTTYRRVDGGAVYGGPIVYVYEPGDHVIEFWSVTEDGVVESPSNVIQFTVMEDFLPPVTVSDARDSYEGTASITLTSTDNSDAGVRYTFYRLNGGPVEVGTQVVVSGPEIGVAFYTLEFWSEDWAGNIETPSKTAIFTIASGT